MKLDWSKLTQTTQRSGLHGLQWEQSISMVVPALPESLPVASDVGNSLFRSEPGTSVLLPVLPDCSQWPGTRKPNVHGAVTAVTRVTAKNSKIEIEEGNGSDRIQPSPAEKGATTSQIFRWAGARFVRRPDAWGSEESLWCDYVGWQQQHKPSAVPRVLFGDILDQLFIREMDGWWGIALRVDIAAAERYIM